MDSKAESGHVEKIGQMEYNHDDFPPGTEYMKETGSHKLETKGDLILVPQPTHDPSDPLNWSKWWKILVIVNASLYTMFTSWPSLGTGPLYPILAAEFNATAEQVGLTTGVLILSSGVGNLLIVPLANLYGRRMALLVCTITSVGFGIWQGAAQSIGSYTAARFIQGIVTSGNESLMPMLVGDMFFLHERGLWMSVYYGVYLTSFNVGPIVGGAIGGDPRLGWRWFFYLTALLQFVSFLFMLVFLPETKYAREARTVENVVANMADSKDTSDSKDESNVTIGPTEHYAGKGRPIKSQFTLLPKRDRHYNMLNDIILPFKMLTYPIIVFATLVFTFCPGGLLIQNITQAGVLISPPYNFSVVAIGQTNWAFAIGALVGLFSGTISDKYAARATRKNGNIREPEMRLPLMLLFVIPYILGLAISGLAEQFGWPWEWIVLFAYPMIGFQIVALPTIATTYAVDSYPLASGHIFLTMTLSKNLWGFAMTYFVGPLIAKVNYGGAFGIFLAMGLTAISTGIPVYFGGKSLRRRTAKDSIHRLGTI